MKWNKILFSNKNEHTFNNHNSLDESNTLWISEISSSQKVTYCMISFILHPQKNLKNRTIGIVQ